MSTENSVPTVAIDSAELSDTGATITLIAESMEIDNRCTPTGGCEPSNKCNPNCTPGEECSPDR